MLFPNVDLAVKFIHSINLVMDWECSVCAVFVDEAYSSSQTMGIGCRNNTQGNVGGDSVAAKSCLVYTLDMSYHGFSAPSPVQAKENGKWSFGHQANGVWSEYGEFSDKSTADREWNLLNAIWETENGKGYVVTHSR